MKNIFHHLLPRARTYPMTAIETLQLRTLNNFIWSSGIAILLVRVILFFLGNPGRPGLYFGITYYLVGALVILLIERYVPYLVVSLIFELMGIQAIILSDTVHELINGESLIYFIIPIAIASLLIRPWAGYVVAGVACLGVTITIIYLGLGIPNIPTFLLFFMVALVIQQSTSRLQRAMEEQERKGRELRESEEKYRRLIDLLPVGVLIYQDGKIVLANPVFLKYARAGSLEDFAGKTLTNFVHPDSRSNALRNAEAAIYQGKTTEMAEEAFYRLDGSIFYAETSRTPFIFNEKPALLIMINDINERKKFQEAITRKNERIQEMSRTVLEIQERERHLLAAELHDDLGQSLTSLKLMLELSSRARSTPARQKRISEARDLAAELMNKVRNLSLDLRPAVLDDFGLFAALRWLVERFETQTGIRVIGEYDPDCDRRFEPPVETTAFRIIQEALTNVARHASVKEARVSITMDERLTIEVVDAGRGFNVEQVTRDAARSTGLSGMQERARLVGGNLEIISQPGSGTRIVAWIPLVGEKI
jgi:PAS domain S-box-containing protein